MRRSRGALLLAVLAVAGAALAGCGGSGSPAAPASTTPRTHAAADGSHRDVYAWPFAWDSIWNLPLANTAQYAPTDLQVQSVYPDVENISLDPDAPVRTLGGAGSGQVHVDPDLHADGSFNNCSTLLLDTDDERTIVQGQPLDLERGGDPSWEYTWDPQSLTGRGIEGCHGGSGLSGLGGSIREGELTANTPIRHALKINLPCDTSCSTERGGHRWPALKADSGYEDKYRGSDPNVNMGTLLALPPDVDLSRITAPDVRRVAEALQTYGAYVADETGGSPEGSLEVQSTALGEFPNIDSGQMIDIIGRLAAVTNSAADTPGGGALDAPRRAACAPPFTDGSGGAPASCGTGS